MLIIEDGTGKPDAQSYVSVSDYRAFSNARGIPVPSNDPDGDAKIETFLVQAIDYLETIPCFSGYKTKETQALAYPRKGVYIHDVLQPDNVIPQKLKTAQIRLAIEASKGVDLMPTLSGNAEDYVIREKVGPIETEFADPTKFNGTATFTAVDALLAPFLGDGCKPGLAIFKVFRG